MKKLTLVTAAVLSAFSFAAQAASVNGQAISQQRIDAVVKMMQAQGQQQVSPAMASEQVITAEILRQEAVKRGLDKSPAVRAQLQNLEAMTLADELLRDHVRRNPVTDAKLLAEYNALKAQMPAKKSYHARHILVKTEAEAQAVLASLKKGKPFAQLAREKSQDPGSAAQGGDLGWSEPGAYVAPFAEALGKLSKGQVTAVPVKTDFGWHIIQLEDSKSESLPPLDSIRPQLTQRVQGMMVEDYIKSLKSKAQIQP
ncbi:peptidylprolyl isomerase [Craterilacuibacter sp. RT1T]|uniref:peptidylprolyl isomerase n=1 Tax=Craterilacuibacter sp. RT1T TaxID=2942211 RepID=UPI0020BE37AA|nr:peptidylprolyl isomerase [Craterilacuibacter sp. RT1T]MCL6262851.1 peptidylprolyl isomerase [Craterilacuibacter sp. RT1T]